MLDFLRRRRDERFAALEAYRHARRAAHEDVTAFGEELAELHVETLTAPLDEPMLLDYQHALDAYEAAKSRLAKAEERHDVTAVIRALAEGRCAHACVLAARDGHTRPTRHEPCFFDPAHGPAERDVEWTPPTGVTRLLPVCFRDYERLKAGEEPDARLVPLGNRRVPWFTSGPLYAAWAEGWYGETIRDSCMPLQERRLTYTRHDVKTSVEPWSISDMNRDFRI